MTAQDWESTPRLREIRNRLDELTSDLNSCKGDPVEIMREKLAIFDEANNIRKARNA